MSNIWGNNFKISIFGESHSTAMGVVIDGIPAGTKLDFDKINFELQRRSPGKNNLSTPRNESDAFEILSGYFNNYTTGTPFSAIIKNTDVRSADYDNIKYRVRPSHADYSGSVKYNGFNDYRGGGHFSGRITALLVFAGAVAKQILENKGINIKAHIRSIKDINDVSYLNTSSDEIDSFFPVINNEIKAVMIKTITDASANGDSVGGSVECKIDGVNAGLGDPFFDSVESRLSQLLFSIPGVKGVEFGLGAEISRGFGSQMNDEFYNDNGTVKTKTNNAGGINGGITNGMPIIFTAYMRPTPSISKEQNTVDLNSKNNTKLVISGRHDPCIVLRAVPVIEACAALCMADFILGE